MRYKSKMIRHELSYGPHFNEELALKAVSNMENEDGTHGAHWSIDETTTVANQYNVNLKTVKFNKYDWFVALNMIYSDYFRAIVNITNTDHVKSFVELTKAWLNDKDVDEGKMWHYYVDIMCDECDDDYDDEYYDYGIRARGKMKRNRYDYDDYDRYDDRRYEPYKLSRY